MRAFGIFLAILLLNSFLSAEEKVLAKPEPKLAELMKNFIEKKEYGKAKALIERKRALGQLHHDSAYFLLSQISLAENNQKEWRNNVLKIKNSEFLNNVKIVKELYGQLSSADKKWLAQHLQNNRIFHLPAPSPCPYFELNQRSSRGQFLHEILTTTSLDKKTNDNFFKELYVEMPESVDAEKMLNDQRFIAWQKTLTAHDFVARMNNLMLFGKNKEARDTYERAKKLLNEMSPDEQCELDYQNAKVERKMRNYQNARRAFQGLAQTCGPSVKQKARYMDLMLASMARDVGARPQFDEFVDDYPTHGLSDDVLFFAAGMERAVGNLDAMFATLDKLIKKFPNGDMIDQALFLKAFEEIKLGKLELAIPALKQLRKKSPPASLTYHQAQYWLARISVSKDIKTLKPVNKTVLAQVKQQLNELLHQKNPSVYSWLSWLLLKELKDDSPLPKLETYKIEKITPSKDPTLVLVHQLIQEGFVNEPLSLLLEQPTAGYDKASVFFMAQLFVDLHGPEMGYQKLIQCGSKSAYILKERPGLYQAIAFPKPYVLEVREATQKADVPPNLIYAIMRRESGYLKDARSWAQARGLMQMMKKTADEQAKKIGIKLESDEDLHKPEVNLLLGATLIKHLMQQFGNLAEVLSAYNAGPAATKTWITKNDQAPVDAYLETISFDETNKYLKYVLEGLFIYSLLEGNNSLSLLKFDLAKK